MSQKEHLIINKLAQFTIKFFLKNIKNFLSNQTKSSPFPLSSLYLQILQEVEMANKIGNTNDWKQTISNIQDLIHIGIHMAEKPVHSNKRTRLSFFPTQHQHAPQYHQFNVFTDIIKMLVKLHFGNESRLSARYHHIF